MSSIHHIPTKIHNQLSLKVHDTKAMLTAIEALLMDQGGRGFSQAEAHGNIHALVCIALNAARDADALSDELETSLIVAQHAA